MCLGSPCVNAILIILIFLRRFVHMHQRILREQVVGSRCPRRTLSTSLTPASVPINEVDKLSNNTVELFALTYVLIWLVTISIVGTVVLCYDSEYSRNITTGDWKARGNFMSVHKAKQAWRQAQLMTKLSIEWRHIDSHTGDALNDRADALADLGAKGNLKHVSSFSLNV